GTSLALDVAIVFCRLSSKKPRQQEYAIFSQIDVLLDDLAPMNGAFSCALCWAARLAVPIHGIGIGSGAQSTPPEPGLASDGVDESLNSQAACAAACTRHGISWRYSEVPRETALCDEVDPSGLLVLSRTLPTKLKRELLGTMKDRPTLVCPSTEM